MKWLGLVLLLTAQCTELSAVAQDCSAIKIKSHILVPTVPRKLEQNRPASSEVLYQRSLLALDAVSNTTSSLYSVPDSVVPIPSGYQKAFAQFDTHTGFHFEILRPQFDFGDTPWFVTAAGTTRALDWILELNRGKQDLPTTGALSEIIRYFGQCNSNPLVISGHGLGGGVAQLISYLVQAQRDDQKIATGQIQLVTWNSFGAQGWIKKATGDFDPAISKQIQAFNYLVSGDPISPIGEHLGQTYQLPIPRREPGVLTDTLGWLPANGSQKTIAFASVRHSLAMIRWTAFAKFTFGIRRAVLVNVLRTKDLEALIAWKSILP